MTVLLNLRFCLGRGRMDIAGIFRGKKKAAEIVEPAPVTKPKARGQIRHNFGLCPICGATDFQDYQKREGEICINCGSKARTRLLFLGLDHFGLTATSKSILHFAPEPGLRELLLDKHGDGHVIADFDPEKLSACANKRKEVVDLCAPPEHLLRGTFDGPIHSHVLEHIPCNWALAFLEIHQSHKADGVHVFSVPINADDCSEDLTPTLTHSERHERFGQFDHLRNFGRKDFPEEVQKLARLTKKSSIAFKRAIPRKKMVDHLAGGTIFALY